MEMEEVLQPIGVPQATQAQPPVQTLLVLRMRRIWCLKEIA